MSSYHFTFLSSGPVFRSLLTTFGVDSAREGKAFPSLHAKLDVFLINKCLIVYPSLALRYPFAGLLFRFKSPEPDLVVKYFRIFRKFMFLFHRERTSDRFFKIDPLVNTVGILRLSCELIFSTKKVCSGLGKNSIFISLFLRR
ncbi:Uncharacterized protein XB16_1999 [Leptospira santarosai]|uniref:Uncharacterized protein n=1 Tax=Leptospira santarosai TaxID=28183 RepID=A0A2P1QTU5_9LEPT|nr:Uncharacterized protein XB16_1999 [Leptospira santarosai]